MHIRKGGAALKILKTTRPQSPLGVFWMDSFWSSEEVAAKFWYYKSLNDINARKTQEFKLAIKLFNKNKNLLVLVPIARQFVVYSNDICLFASN